MKFKNFFGWCMGGFSLGASFSAIALVGALVDPGMFTFLFIWGPLAVVYLVYMFGDVRGVS